MNWFSVESAIKPRPEFSFWPAAVSGYLFTETNDSLYLLLLFIFLFTGIMMYKVHKHTLSRVDSIKGGILFRRLVYRRGDRAKFTDILEEVKRVTDPYLPKSQWALLIAGISVMINFFSIIVLWIFLVDQMIGGSIHPVRIGLFILPILWVLGILSTYIYHS